MSLTDWFDTAAAIPGLRGVAVHILAADREAEVREVLEAAGFRVATLDGARIRNEAAFFREVARALELPGHFGNNWDALDEGLRDLDDGVPRRRALLWRDADESAGADAQAFLDAVGVLSAVSRDLGSGDPPAQIEIFLLGTKGGFAPSGRGGREKRR